MAAIYSAAVAVATSVMEWNAVYGIGNNPPKGLLIAFAMMSAGFVALLAIMVAASWIWSSVTVGPDGIDVPDQRQFIPWRAISEVGTVVSWGVPHLRIRTTTSPLSVTIPPLAHMARFTELAAQYGGVDNPLTVALRSAGA